MLITCPNCRTTYNVPSLANQPEQKVRCVKCKHVWDLSSEAEDPFFITFAIDKLAEQPEQEPEQSLPAFQEIFKESEKKDYRFLEWLKPLYFFSLFCIAASIYLFFFHPQKQIPVILQTASYELTQENDKTFLLLEAAAFNNTDEEILPETFTVRFVDKDDHTLSTTALESPVNVLPPHNVENINIKIERPPSNTAKVFITLTKTRSR